MPLVLNGIQNATGGSGSLIAITRKPVKLNYIEGERLSLNGMQITFYSANKAPIVVEDYITIPAKDTILSRSDSQVVIQYRSNDGEYFQTVLPINIKYPVNIEVKNLPNRSYKKADNINLKGLKIDLIYNDNSRSLVDNAKITSYPADGTPLGNNTSLLFTYNDEDVRLDCFYELGGKGSNDIDETKITTFASGTWEEIEKMLKAYRSGKLDMEDYWKVGDTRSAEKSEPFNDELVVLGFNSRLNQYAGKNHVLIGNKTISRSKSNYGIYGSNTLGMKMFGNATHIWFKSSFSPYDDDYYSELDNQLKTSAVNKLIMTNTTAEDSSIFSTYAGNYVSMYSVSRDVANIALGTTANYANKKIRVYKYNDIFENNAFEYYKVASNRVKTQNSVPTKYIIDNYLVNTNGLTVLNYDAASPACITYSYSSDSYSGSIDMYTNAPESYKNIKYIARYIDIDGTQKECNVSENLGFAYYFAIG